jgi:uncharacterized glyoxalase superfamily protein PhnB/DNA-directed RNA polymerase specialized sigma24 family protein
VTDADVIAASLVDPRQFATVFDRHAGTVFRFLVRRVGRDTADELLADTFRIAFEVRSTFDTARESARPWLYGIANNLVTKHRRTEARRFRATARLVNDTANDLPPEQDRAVSETPDPLDALRDLRPDRIQSGEPNDPWLLARERDRLMSVVEQTELEARSAWQPPAIYPRLGYEDERAAIDFLTRAFGFRERREARMEHETGVLAWLEHGDGVVMVGHVNTDVHRIHSPQQTGAATCMLNVTVDDVDAHYARAVAEGAVITMELNDAFYGERRYEASDPEGNRWHFGESLEHVRRRRGTR